MADFAVSRIIDIIAAHFEVPAEEISPLSEFETFEFDSLAITELAVILTREFGVEVTDEDLAGAKTVGRAADLVAAQAAAWAGRRPQGDVSDPARRCVPPR
jgi:acyl carrier protein